MRQLIIARKDLNMSPGKLAAQCSHGSMAFMAEALTQKEPVAVYDEEGNIVSYRAEMNIPSDVYTEWFSGAFTKTVCAAKNRYQLMKAKTMAEELGLVENKDFFLICDACLTELEPEEFDEDGNGYTVTVIGFRPLPDEIAHKISKKYQLYH